MEMMRKCVLICLVLSLASCDSDSVSGPQLTSPGCTPLFSLWLNVFEYTQVHGVCESALLRYMTTDNTSIDEYVTTANFCISEDKAASVEYISANNVQLQGDSSLYLTVDPIPQRPFLVWSFGGGDVPEVHDSVMATTAFTITSPRHLQDTISKQGGLRIKYDPTGTETIEVYIAYDPVLSREYDPTIKDSTFTASTPVTVQSTGNSLFMPAIFGGSQFSTAFPKRGIATLHVIARRKKAIIVDGKLYVFFVGERCQSKFFFKP